jgi:CubicO group peptidase (beta-lactamase class C family)
VESGEIDLSLTLAELDIDDQEGLSDLEKQVTIYDLLTARSGIYHPAGYETPWMRSIKPARHSYAPGTWWCYSNWDFNALGTIFTKLTGLGIHAAFAERIAKPLGMQDFRFTAESQDGWLEPSERSRHPAYPFRMSTRDLARFGFLFLRDGRGRQQQVVPANWTATSVLPYSDAGPRGAYGYMWWVTRCGVGFPGVVSPEGTYSARGAGGHYCVVIPPLDLVIVHRVDTDQRGREVNRFQFGELLRLILGARRHQS